MDKRFFAGVFCGIFAAASGVFANSTSGLINGGDNVEYTGWNAAAFIGNQPDGGLIRKPMAQGGFSPSIPTAAHGALNENEPDALQDLPDKGGPCCTTGGTQLAPGGGGEITPFIRE